MVIVFWRRGTGSASKEVIELRDQQVAAFKDEIKRLEEKMSQDRSHFNQEIKELTGKLGEMTGALTTRNDENKSLRDLLTNRNPEMEDFFKRFKEMLPTFNQLLILMQKIDSHLQK